MRKSDLENSKRVYLRALHRISLIHEEISAESFPSVAKLAGVCGVNERTIKRDLDLLRFEMKAPIVYERRQKGFRYKEIGWSLPSYTITEGELLALFIAEQALRLTGNAPEADQLKASVGKLIARLPDEVSVNLATLGESINFQNLPSVTVAPQVLHLVARSAINQTPLEFDYYSPHSQTKTHRVADVHLLHNFIGDWYAISFDHERQAFRDFSVGRMSDLKETDQYFEPQKQWNAEDYLKKGFYMMRGGRQTTVKILFDPYQAQWIRERQYFHPDETKEELPDGSLRLSFQIGENGLDAVARFCLTYAGNCTAEKPAKLRTIIREKLKKATEMHR